MSETNTKAELDEFIENNPGKEIPVELKRKIAKELKLVNL